eukprot:3331415-Pyramimonas_sp.AAC.3
MTFSATTLLSPSSANGSSPADHSSHSCQPVNTVNTVSQFAVSNRSVTVGHSRSQTVTIGHSRSQTVTVGHSQSQTVTVGHRRSQSQALLPLLPPPSAPHPAAPDVCALKGAYQHAEGPDVALLGPAAPLEHLRRHPPHRHLRSAHHTKAPHLWSGGGQEGVRRGSGGIQHNGPIQYVSPIMCNQPNTTGLFSM